MLANEREPEPTDILLGTQEDKVVLMFRQPLLYIGMTPNEARNVAAGLIERANAVEAAQEHHATRH